MLLGRTLHERLRTFDLEELYRQTSGLYDFADARGLQPIAVRIVDSPPAGTALELNVPDAPFLVDTVRAAVQGAGHSVRLLLHPIVGVERDAEGRIIARRGCARGERARVGHAAGARAASSTPRGGRGARRRRCARRSAELQLAVGDFAAMLAMVERMAAAAHAAAAVRDADEVEETAAFLDWLRDGHFILLGARAYERGGRADGPDRAGPARLGPRHPARRRRHRASPRPTPVDELPEFLRERLVASGDLLVIGKTNRRSRVHRRARMDDVSRARAAPGRHASRACCRVIGLFTSLVYLEQASRTPLLRRKLQAIIEAEGLIEGSHDYKATVAAFESFPRDELFQAPVDALRAEIVAAARAEEAQRVTLTVRRDAASRNITVMVAMPGDRMSTELRMRLQELLARRASTPSRSSTTSRSSRARRRSSSSCCTSRRRARPTCRSHELEQEVARLARTWDDRLADELVARYGDAEGRRLAALYCRAAARLLQDRDAARARARRHRAARARRRRRGVRRRPAERAAPRTRRWARGR